LNTLAVITLSKEAQTKLCTCRVIRLQASSSRFSFGSVLIQRINAAAPMVVPSVSVEKAYGNHPLRSSSGRYPGSKAMVWAMAE